MSTTDVPPADLAGSSVALVALNQRRSARRLKRIDRFDAFYQAYVTALVGGIVVLFLSEWAGGAPLPGRPGALAADATPWLGLLSALVIGAGLRSGGRGGPLALGAPEVRHVLLSPVPRSVSLRTPALRQLRFLAAASAAGGAVIGQVASHRLPGHALAWTATGVIWSTATVAAAVAAGWLAAGRRLGPARATAGAAVIVAGAVAEVVGVRPLSPTHWFGLLGVLPLRTEPVAVLALASALLALTLGLTRLAGTSVEQLARRSALVGELRFAATMRDLRTVMLLRRQLHQERARRTPWLRTFRRGGRCLVVTRDWRALKRTPATRVLRLLALAAGATASAIGAWNGTTALVAVAGLCAFLAGLEALEPLAQEVDRSWILDLAPVNRGVVMSRHLIVPMAVSAALALVAAVAVFPFAADASSRRAIVVVAAVAPLAAVAGAAISVLRDGRGPGAQAIDELMLPPEAVGMRLLYRTALPPAAAAAGFLPVVMARKAFERGADPVQSANSAGFLVLVLVAAVVLWVRHGDDLSEGLAVAARPASTPRSS